MAATENRRGGKIKGMFNVSCLSVSVWLILVLLSQQGVLICALVLAL